MPMVHAPERRIPTTYDRAATELVRCRQHLETARESLEVALGILRHLNGEADDVPRAALEAVLGGLEEAEAALRSAMR
jgi:hypothetical protein